MSDPKKDVAPEPDLVEEDDEETLPEADEAAAIERDVEEAGSLAAGRDAIVHAIKEAPSRPGVYRMIDGRGDVLYVGKAKNIKKRIAAYARPTGLDTRIERMIAQTRTLEFVVTRTETEALLLEANLIKRLRPRFNVTLRDDKSFPYILITSDHWAPQILKHRGARSRPGQYYGPFASVWAVNRTINALQRAFLLRSCSDPFFESRTRPCLLYQIKRCSAPCTKEIEFRDYAALVREANAFLSGRSKSVKDQLAAEMEKASTALDFEHAAIYRDRLAALSAIQSHQGINPRSVEEADVFAVHQQGGFTCVEVFFFRTGQNWGNRAYFPKADRSLGPGEVLSAFLAQFYDDKPPPRLILISHAIEDWALLAEALATKSGHKVEISLPQRGEKKDLIAHALANAREALGRKLAETSSQQKLLRSTRRNFRPAASAAPHRSLRQQPHPGHQRGRRHDRRRAGRLSQKGLSQVQHPLDRAHPRRRFRHDARSFAAPLQAADERGAAEMPSPLAGEGGVPQSGTPGEGPGIPAEAGILEPSPALALLGIPPPQGGREDDDESPWPDLVLIDGGLGQLNAAREVLAGLGAEVPLAAIAKGPDRDAGRETFFLPGRDSFKLPPRDPVLYFVERLRDEAHRFAVGSHRTRRARDMREAGLQEIAGIGPTRKRALLHHFGTLKAIERASVTDLMQVEGISAETARRIYEFFHEGAA